MMAVDRSAAGVSFVIPVRNGAPWIRDAIDAVWRQADGCAMEVIAVDDGSTDGSSNILLELATQGRLQLIAGDGRGAAAAINRGVRAARFPIICQVDQDVILQPDWMRHLVAVLADPRVAAAQGYYASDPSSTICARVMGLDLELRYAVIPCREIDHVCTGNAAYRADALQSVGLFDERLGYGYDNDMSYRLQDAGHRLVFCREARSVHRWREGFGAYCVQQYGFGYGRLELVAKHPRRVGGDSVSPLPMMLHPIAMAIAVVCAACAGLSAMTSGPAGALALGATAIVTGLAVERSVAGLRASRWFGDRAALLFPVLHFVRDLAWVAAIATWLVRRLARVEPRPSDSMGARLHHRRLVSAPDPVAQTLCAPRRVLGIIPAHNEAPNLPAVLAEVRACCPSLAVLVVDDGSTDGTASLLDTLGIRWLGFPERMGIGSAMRAGLRYAVRLGYDAAVRLDGDGQHPPDEIERMLEPLRKGEADVVLGSRYISPSTQRPERPWTEDRPADVRNPFVRITQRLLASCLSTLTGRVVTDPTSGFYALGPKALSLLASHHPTGYPEPELRLFLSRNGLTAVEVPVRARPRLAGRTSLMPTRWTAAGARMLLALLVVPLRGAVGGRSSD